MRLRLLLKLRFESMLAGFFTRNGKDKRKTMSTVSMLVLFGVLILFFLVFFFMTFSGIALLWVGQGYDRLYFSFTAFLVFTISFLFTIFMARSQLFEAKDNDFLFSLPVKERDILLSRMLSLLLSDYLFEWMVLLPATVAWLVFGGFRPLSLLCILVASVFLPFFSMIASCLVGWLLAFVCSKMKNPQILNTALGVFFMGAYFYVYFRYLTVDAEAMGGMAESLSPVLSRIPPLDWFGQAAANGDFHALLFFVLSALLPFAVLCWIIALTFRRLAYGGKHAKVLYREKKRRQSGVVWAIAKKEFAHFTGSSAYMLNAGVGLLMLFGGSVAALFFRRELFIFSAGMGEMAVIFPMMAAGFISAMILISAPALSLEGKSLPLLQSLPVRGSVILRAKMLPHILLGVPVALVSGILLSVAFSLPVLPALAFVLYAICFQVYNAVLGVFINLRVPRFDWVNETTVVKQSAAVGLTMLFAFLTVIVTVGGAALLCFVVPPFLAVAVSVVLLLALTAVFYSDIQRSGDRRFAALSM